MFIIFLNYTNRKHLAAEYMQSHLDWIASGISANTFLLAGSLAEGNGGCILAHNISKDTLTDQVNLDPFVEHDIVNAEVLEIDPKVSHERLQFLMK